MSRRLFWAMLGHSLLPLHIGRLKVISIVDDQSRGKTFVPKRAHLKGLLNKVLFSRSCEGAGCLWRKAGKMRRRSINSKFLRKKNPL